MQQLTDKPIKQIPTELNYYWYLHKQQKQIIRQVAINRLVCIGLITWLIGSGIYHIISYQLWINSTL